MTKTNPINTFITLDLDTGEKEFLDIEELKEWLQKERREFAWLSDMYRGGNSGAAQAWSLIDQWLGHIDNFIRNFTNNSGNESHQQSLISDLKNEVRTYVQKYRVRSSESADAQFVLQLRGSYEDRVAGYAMSFLMGQDFNFSTPLALKGAYLALQYQHGSKETVVAQQKALDALKRGWSTRFGKQHNELKAKKEELTIEVSGLRDQFSAIKEKISQQQSHQKTRFDELLINVESKLLDIAKT